MDDNQKNSNGKLVIVKENNANFYFQMGKRDLFAAMAMQGYCSGKIGEMDFQKVAELAVKQADALLEKL